MGCPRDVYVGYYKQILETPEVRPIYCNNKPIMVKNYISVNIKFIIIMKHVNIGE